MVFRSSSDDQIPAHGVKPVSAAIPTPSFSSARRLNAHYRLVRSIVQDPQAITKSGDDAIHVFTDILARVDGVVPRDPDLLLRIAAASGQPQCFCDLVSWARQNGLRGQLETAFDRLVGNSSDPFFARLAMIITDERSRAGVSGISMVPAHH